MWGQIFNFQMGFLKLCIWSYNCPKLFRDKSSIFKWTFKNFAFGFPFLWKDSIYKSFNYLYISHTLYPIKHYNKFFSKYFSKNMKPNAKTNLSKKINYQKSWVQAVRYSTILLPCITKKKCTLVKVSFCTSWCCPLYLTPSTLIRVMKSLINLSTHYCFSTFF